MNTVINNILDEMAAKDPKFISALAKRITSGLFEECSPATQIITIASILLSLLEEHKISYINALSAADCLVHSGEFNNVNEYFKKEGK